MTVGELKNSLKGYRNDDVVYMVTDYDIVNDEGELTELAELKEVNSQPLPRSEGSYKPRHRILLEF